MANENSLRVIGGRDARRDEFPFVARLDRILLVDNHNQSFELFDPFCTGSILTPTWTLTAGHCLDWIDSEPLRYVMYIRYNNYFPDIKGEISEIIKFYVHPRLSLIPRCVRNDIALLNTKNAIISRYAKLSAVDYTSLFGHEVYVLGYGLTNVTGNPPPLQVLKGMSTKCIGLTGRSVAGISTGICLKVPCSVKASMAPGDSGSPMVHPTGVVAVLSMGETQYSKFRFRLYIPKLNAETGVFTPISPLLDWILTSMKRKENINRL